MAKDGTRAIGLGSVLLTIPVIAFSVLYILNAFVSEDAYILFRVAEQFHAGRGLVWNPDERVQVFTSPLWMLSIIGLRALTRDLFLACVAAGYLLSMLTLWHLRRACRAEVTFLLLVLILMSAAGWMDYTSSGLENTLLFALLSGFLIETVGGIEAPAADRDQHLQRAGAIAGLLLITRHDIVTLLWPMLLLLGQLALKRGVRWSIGHVGIPLTAPLALWTIFSLVYYGSPFPNTAYAKLAPGISRSALVGQSQLYWQYAINHDPVAMFTIAAAPVAVIWRRRRFEVAALAGVLSNLAYITYIGADYMGGRFYGAGVMVSALLLARALDSLAPGSRMAVLITMAAMLLGYQFTSELSTFHDRSRNRIHDAMFYGGVVKGKVARHDNGSFYNYLTMADRSGFPDILERHEGQSFYEAATPYKINAAIGAFGYYAGTEKVIIDPLAIADPFLARLPASGLWRAGHFYRCIPRGYVESRVSRTNQIVDTHLSEYYDRVRPIYQGDDLFTWSRLRAILDLNSGRLARLLQAYVPPADQCEPLVWQVDQTWRLILNRQAQPPDRGDGRQ